MSAHCQKPSACSFADIASWNVDDLLPAFEAFCLSARYMQNAPYPTKPLGADGLRLKEIGARALSSAVETSSQARSFFEDHFLPHRIASAEPGFLTGFFEPEVPASRTPDEIYRYPLYRRPEDLVDLRDHNRPASMDESYRFGRSTAEGIRPYFDRSDIDAGALADRGLEIAWISDRVDQFFIHVQGAAKLCFEDGTYGRVTFDGKSGHPYTSLGKILCERLDVPPFRMTADRLAAWMRGNPDDLDDLLACNRSYIFFREVDGLDSSAGPVAAAGCSLTAGRSLAVDRTLHTFGTPVWIETRDIFVNDNKPLARLMIAQDTGSAITGPCRGDIFIGSGSEAGLIAGKVRHEIDMITMLPRENT